jgi:hypothetical protein
MLNVNHYPEAVETHVNMLERIPNQHDEELQKVLPVDSGLLEVALTDEHQPTRAAISVVEANPEIRFSIMMYDGVWKFKKR